MNSLGKGPSVLLYDGTPSGTLISSDPLLPPDPPEVRCDCTTSLSFPFNKPLDPTPECSIGSNPSIGSRVESSKSPSSSWKSKGSTIRLRYLVNMAQRCGTLLAIEVFVQEVVILNIEVQHEEKWLDDGFRVYEMMNDEDPVNEDDRVFGRIVVLLPSGVSRRAHLRSVLVSHRAHMWFLE
ncbi:hypothetical protein Taro_043527 [Colocasia esculenta]|uniref:Uncharacterized protein n=1 Tax=Colocasia esculenta TaxID=4460 RepID=A0A843WJN9_COLES|nr:hypothetical protein [Colocasia esculenta]